MENHTLAPCHILILSSIILDLLNSHRMTSTVPGTSEKEKDNMLKHKPPVYGSDILVESEDNFIINREQWMSYQDGRNLP